jgi:hypothetical protein
VDAPSTASMCHRGGVVVPLREASVPTVTTIGLDMPKMVFQVHGADACGEIVFRRTLRRPKVLEFFAQLPRGCHGGMCWCTSLGARDRPSGSYGPTFVAVKSEAAQASATIYRRRPAAGLPLRLGWNACFHENHACSSSSPWPTKWHELCGHCSPGTRSIWLPPWSGNRPTV